MGFFLVGISKCLLPDEPPRVPLALFLSWVVHCERRSVKRFMTTTKKGHDNCVQMVRDYHKSSERVTIVKDNWRSSRLVINELLGSVADCISTIMP